MRHDPQIEVTCDTCGDCVTWEPSYVYRDWSGSSGYYDTSDGAYQKFLAREGWSGDGDKDTCYDCLEREGAS